MKKVIIVGGGIAGLTAGIYLQQADFLTEIYEKNAIPGGQCTGWKRGDYFIDNCIHWLTGTKEGSDLNFLWKNVGAIRDNIELVHTQKFYSAELNGEKITFWSDLERTRKEMLELSPEDSHEINQFIDFTIMAQSMQFPLKKPFDMMNFIDYIKLGISMADVAKVLKVFGNIDTEEFSKRFKHPLLQSAMRDYMPPKYQAYSLLVSYATIASGNGDIPMGGSKEMVLRIVKRYEELGGKLHLNAGVYKVLVEGKKSTGIQLEDMTEKNADYVICACDTDFTFKTLLDKKYMPKSLKEAYSHRDKYPVISGFHVAFSVDDISDELSGVHIMDCEPFKIANSVINRISYHGYNDQPDFAPEGKSILQSSFVQTEFDYEYWNMLYQNHEAYKKVKYSLAEEVKKRLLTRFPNLQGKIQILDVWTPATYHRYCNSYCGAYMSFIITKHAKDQRIAGKIKGLDNVMIASQWLMGPGGLPTAAAMGKFSAQRIMKKENLGITC